jgi:A/G-specific adenine glycosylase
MAGERPGRQDLSAREDSIREGFRKKGLTPGIVGSFRRFLMQFYESQGRDLPWRRTTDPYRILVSEFMLQQTQVERVLAKYPEFIGRFPDIRALARAPIREVLHAWQGLGYNRRALALHGTAVRILEEFHGEIPLDRATLESLPGIGSATAGAIVVFSTNRPEVFIETNIRRVYIHLFFPDAERVHDREIEPILRKTLVRGRSRDFYYALMDYGSFLKRSTGNPNTRSASYSRQSPFPGSDREKRGIILRRLLAAGEIRKEDLGGAVPVGSERLDRILRGLEKEGFIERKGGRIRCRGDFEAAI